jgi:hypothetical protein
VAQGRNGRSWHKAVIRGVALNDRYRESGHSGAAMKRAAFDSRQTFLCNGLHFRYRLIVDDLIHPSQST